MYRGYKLRLIVNKTQKKYLLELFEIMRTIYNGALNLINKYYEEYNKLISTDEIRTYFNHYVMNNESKIRRFPINTLKLVMNTVYLDFKKKTLVRKEQVNYKSILGSYLTILLDPNDFCIKDERVYLKFLSSDELAKNGIKFYETNYLPRNGKRINPRLGYDGIDFYFSTVEPISKKKYDRVCCLESLGIDVGIKNFATFSNGMVFENVNKSLKVKRLNEMVNYYQRKLTIIRSLSEQQKRPLSHNYFKVHKRFRKVLRKIVRIRENSLYCIVKEVVKLKPKYVCIEDLLVKDLAHENTLAKYIFEQTFRKFRTILEYKCSEFGINICVADRYYPSSKICSNCGCVIKDLSLSDRTYVCPHCHTIIDRDLNAAINLSRIFKSIKTLSSGRGYRQLATSRS